MRQSRIVKKLRENGWKQSINDKTIWCYGRASIMFYKDEDEKVYIMSSRGDCGAVENIRMITLTPYRILIQWKSFEEWYIIY